MVNLMTGALSTIVHLLDPRDCPRMNREDLVAASFGVGAAIFAVIAWAGVWGLFTYLAETGPLFGIFLLAGYALLLVVPAAFVVAFLGGRVYRPTSLLTGGLSGVIATGLTYAVSVLMVGVMLFAAPVIPWLEPVEPIGGMLEAGLVALFTSFFLTFPLGFITGAVYGSYFGRSSSISDG